mmetsp:Transcript_61957/g.102300  ORF Transcript_61957/g.102300 Transcript_61957/m.102300 type:complete len:272 (-) Transcript_61957:400-1215(-)
MSSSSSSSWRLDLVSRLAPGAASCRKHSSASEASNFSGEDFESGSTLDSCFKTSADRVSGISTSITISRDPLSNGFLCLGMPSLGMAIVLPGLTTFPGCDLTSRVRPSKCLMGNENPHSASARLIVLCITKSWPFRSKRSCFFSCSTITTSPGILMSGCWSPSRENVILSLCFIPLSMCTSRIFFSLLTRFPEHAVHRSLGSTATPSPLQAGHVVCICCTMPGPSCRTTTRIPCPRHSWHVLVRPLVLDPLPLQVEQITCLLRASFRVLPL